MNRQDHHWSLMNLLLAEVVDNTRVANWQRGNGRRQDYPKPIPRPGYEPDEKTYGSGALPLDEMAEWLAAINPGDTSGD